MESKKTKKRTKEEINKDMSPTGRVRNRPINHLAKDDFLQIQVNLLQREKHQLELNNIKSTIDNHEKAIFILRSSIEEKKQRLRKIEMEHETFINDLEKRTGINIRGKSIDFITREVIDIENN